MAAEKTRFHIGRKFIAFIIVLIALIVLGILNKGDNMAPYIVGLYVAYATGNVATKHVTKEANDGGTTDER